MQPENRDVKGAEPSSDLAGNLPQLDLGWRKLLAAVTGELEKKKGVLSQKGIDFDSLPDEGIREIAKNLARPFDDAVLDQSKAFFAEKARELFAKVEYGDNPRGSLYLIGPPHSKTIISLSLEGENGETYLKVRRDYPYALPTEFILNKDSGEILSSCGSDHLRMFDKAFELAENKENITFRNPTHFP
jgi:hypothetical protein